MSYKAFHTRVWNENILFSAMLELTYNCNLDCYFCYNDLALKGEPLSMAQFRTLFSDLRDMGTMNLTLTGGEPLAHRDFFLIGKTAREYGFVIRIKSNGHAFSETTARRVKDEIDPFSIDISLHGATADVHDRQTSVSGSFDRLVRNLRIMKKLGLRVQLRSTLTAWNVEQVEQMFALVDDIGYPLAFSWEVTPRDDGDQDPLSISPSAEGLERLIRLQRARSQERHDSRQIKTGDTPQPDTIVHQKHCGAGSGGVTIDPHGNVYPCVQWRRTVGNLHQQSIKDIWYGSKELERVRRLTTEAKGFVASLGEVGQKIGFCPALAEEATGSPVKLSPAIQKHLRVMQQLETSKVS